MDQKANGISVLFGQFGLAGLERLTPTTTRRPTLVMPLVVLRGLDARGQGSKSISKVISVFIKVISVLCYYLTAASIRQADVRFTRRVRPSRPRGRGEIESYVEPSDGPEHLEK